MERLINCSLVQPYYLNRAYVVFLRAHSNPTNKENTEKEGPESQVQTGESKKKGKKKRSGGICIACSCTLRGGHNRYCSITCKVKQLMETEGSITRHLCDFSLLPIPSNREKFSKEHTSAYHIPGVPSCINSSGSGGNGSASIELPRRKRRNEEEASSSRTMHVHRRKGVPSRSPFC